MNEKQMSGKYLAYVLRHNPSAVGVALNENGWADVDELIEGAKRVGRSISLALLEEIVQNDNKRRFAFSEDKSKIRAVYGHSIAVDLQLEEKTPPDILYHGTAEKYLDSIKNKGIEKRNRQYVHLSCDEQTAIKVGARHGKPIVLRICAGQMAQDGCKFYQAENGVWLTDAVPIKYISKLNTK